MLGVQLVSWGSLAAVERHLAVTILCQKTLLRHAKSLLKHPIAPPGDAIASNRRTQLLNLAQTDNVRNMSALTQAYSSYVCLCALASPVGGTQTISVAQMQIAAVRASTGPTGRGA